MNLREAILQEHSKTQCTKIVDWVGDSQQRFNQLFQLFLQDEYRVVQRAAWPVSYCVEAHPEFIRHNFDKLLNNLQRSNQHVAVKRNTIRLLQYVQIPKKFQGKVMNICFEYLESPDTPVAIKAFSLTVLANLSTQYPDIIPELRLIIEDLLPNQTAAFSNRANHLLRSWEKMQQKNQQRPPQKMK